MSRQEILDLIAPPKEIPVKFVSWVQSVCGAAVYSVENMGDAVRVVSTVDCAKTLLNIDIVIYEHIETGK